MSRITQCFQELNGGKALIPFITAGDPKPDITVSLMHGLVEGGADMIELGIPFSDPMADGPVIQRASDRALRHNVSVNDVLLMVQDFRRQNQNTPIILMGYLNPIASIGYAAFARRAAEAGVDGVLVVDCPIEEASELAADLNRYALSPIFLVAPTTSRERLAKIMQYAKGFIYYVSLKGVTGAATLDLDEVRHKVAQLRPLCALPIAVGFGVRDAKTAQALALFADAVVVGSRMVEEIENSTPDTAKLAVTRLVTELKRAVSADLFK